MVTSEHLGLFSRLKLLGKIITILELRVPIEVYSYFVISITAKGIFDT